jgi:hypothetical protein
MGSNRIYVHTTSSQPNIASLLCMRATMTEPLGMYEHSARAEAPIAGSFFLPNDSAHAESSGSSLIRPESSAPHRPYNPGPGVLRPALCCLIGGPGISTFSIRKREL